MIASTLFERSNFQNKPTTIQHRRYPIPTKVSMKRPSLVVPPSVWKSRLMGGFLSVLFPRRSSFHDSSPHQPRIRYSIAILPLFFTQRFFLYSLRLPPVAKSREYTFVGSRASSSTIHDPRHYWLNPAILGLQRPPCEIQFLRVQSIEPIRHFVLFLYKTVHGGFFFSLSLSLFPPRSNCRDPDPGKKLLKFRFLSDLSPRKFNRILFRFERFTCDTSVQICDRAAG